MVFLTSGFALTDCCNQTRDHKTRDFSTSSDAHPCVSYMCGRTGSYIMYKRVGGEKREDERERVGSCETSLVGKKFDIKNVSHPHERTNQIIISIQNKMHSPVHVTFFLFLFLFKERSAYRCVRDYIYHTPTGY